MSSGFIFDVEGTLIDCVPQTLKSLLSCPHPVGRVLKSKWSTYPPGMGSGDRLTFTPRHKHTPQPARYAAIDRVSERAPGPAWSAVFATFAVPSQWTNDGCRCASTL